MKRWKRHYGIRTVGKTELGLEVISGSDLFNVISSQGITLDTCLTYFKKQNKIVDWIGFIDESLKSNWTYKTILKKVSYSLLDVYDEQYTEQVIVRMKYYIINKEIKL